MMVLRTTANSLFQQQQQQRQTGLYGVIGEEMLSSSSCNLEEDLNTSHAENQHHHTQNLLYNLTMLREKLHQVENLLLMRPLSHGQDTTATAASAAAAVIQEIMVTASSMIFSCQQMALNASMIHNTTTTTANDSEHHHLKIGLVSGMGGDGFYKDGHSNKTDTNDNSTTTTNNNNKAGEVDGGINSNGNKSKALSNRGGGGGGGGGGSGGGGGGGGGDFFSSSTSAYDIIELDAGDLLAENSHYCHICGKGFKRDANLRMHMRAHGDEYKSNAALTKPPPPPLPPRRSSSSGSAYEEYAYSQFMINLPRKYSCPQEGCRWNKKHAKFQPLKSMICVKNHYKRSHCPKMYVCNRCNRKKFSVLSDLRTHEKHCGDLKWRCSCGTTFSRKDKLLGHLALFVGHAPATQPIT